MQNHRSDPPSRKPLRHAVTNPWKAPMLEMTAAIDFVEDYAGDP